MLRNDPNIDKLIADQKPGHALDGRFYTDDDIYSLELDRIVFRNWILAAHESEFPEIGDFKVAHVGSESAIIVRGSDGAIKAFANVCRHRGSLVCLQQQGSVRKFTCPYHGWMYDIDGNLTAARNMPEGFDKAGHGLARVSVATVEGLIFICFSDNPPSMEGLRSEMAEVMDMFGFKHLKVAAFKDYDIPANWKLAIENYMECYHCATAHPDYAKMHTLMLQPEKRDRLQGHMLEKMPACGMRDILIDRIDGRARPGECGYGYSRTALFEGYQTGSRDGSAVAPLLGGLNGYDGGASDFVFGPFTYLLGYSDHVICYVFTPVDRANCRCDIYWLVRDDAVAGRDYNVNELTWLWDITTQSDKEIIVNNWKGVQSRYYRPGPFSSMERSERSFVEWILQELARG